MYHVRLFIVEKMGFRAVDSFFCLPSICVSNPPKIQKYYFLSIRPWEHLEWHGATCSGTIVPEVPFSSKMTKMPLVSSRFDWWSNVVWTLKKNVFQNFTSNSSFSKIFSSFDWVWPSLTRSRPRVGPKTLILIRQSNRVETNTIVKIIEFSFQWLFMGQNRS